MAPYFAGACGASAGNPGVAYQFGQAQDAGVRFEISSRSVPVSAPAKALGPKAFAIWTTVTAVLLTLCYWGILNRVAAAAVIVGFFSLFVIMFALSWTGRFARVLPAVLAAALAGLWPWYRWLALGDARSAQAYLTLVGLLAFTLLGFTGMEAAKQRGWIVESARRRKLSTYLVVVFFLSSVAGWPTGIWHNVLFASGMVTFFLTFFWPARRRAGPQDHPAAV